MWLFTPHFYLSVVKKPGDRKLCVRARCSDHLDAFRQLYAPSLTATIHTKQADYPARAYIGRHALTKAMKRIVKALVYSNFKSETARVQGYSDSYSSMLHDVWHATHKIRNKAKHKAKAQDGLFDRGWPPQTPPAPTGFGSTQTYFGEKTLPPAYPRGQKPPAKLDEIELVDDDRDIPPAELAAAEEAALAEFEAEEARLGTRLDGDRAESKWLKVLRESQKRI